MNIADLGVVSVGAITILAYVAGLIAQRLPLENKWIPCICGCVGIVLGIISMYVMPDYPADNVISAAAVGAISGLAATGIDQIYRQLHPSDKGRITGYAYSEYDENGDPVPGTRDEEDA